MLPEGPQGACGGGHGPSWEEERLAPPWRPSLSRPLKTSSATPWEQGGDEKSRREQDEGKMDGGLFPSLTFIGKGGQPPASTTSRHHDLLHAASTSQVEQLPRQHGETESPTSNQSPCVIKAVGG